MLKSAVSPKGVFVTGTDTGVGKTLVSSLLCAYFKNKYPLRYFKPVQTGCSEFTSPAVHSLPISLSDTATVKALASLTGAEVIEPLYNFDLPASPDRAAHAEGQTINVKALIDKVVSLRDHFLVVEGAGGVEVPLTQGFRMSDLMHELRLPVIIVASTRLGTMNHTFLTLNQLKVSGVQIAGVILSGSEDSGLEAVLCAEGVPVLGRVPYLQNTENMTEVFADPSVDQCFKNLEKTLTKDTSGRSPLLAKDAEVLWHPFTQHKIEKDFPLIVSGSGSRLFTDTGHELIDATSSWWVNLHGHAHPEIVRTIAEQAARLEHVLFAGYTHEPAIVLGECLLAEAQKVNPQLAKVFYSDNGSTAVEVALKMAYQYHQLKGEKRTRFLALTDSYHGDTVGAMSVSEPSGFHKYFLPLMMPVDHVKADDFDQLEALLPQMHSYAACIVEPMVQGAGGMKMHSPAYLQKLQTYCRANGVLLIADEIFTGFGRTGPFLASEHASFQADLVCLSKGITGGFLPLSATLATADIYNMFLQETKANAFLHGHSYTANPIACAAAVKSFEILKRSQTQENIARIAAATQRSLSELQRKYPESVRNVRSLGTIGAFDLATDEDYYSFNLNHKMVEVCFRKGVLLRPLGKTFYTVPPYCTSDQDIETIYEALSCAITQVMHKGDSQ